MLEYLLLLLSLIRAAVRDREALVADNLLLQHQLAALTRPTRKRPRLRTRDKLFWVVIRALRRDWRRHLVVVRPESVIRWQCQAWHLNFGMPTRCCSATASSVSTSTVPTGTATFRLLWPHRQYPL
jgi:hypothetical protein